MFKESDKVELKREYIPEIRKTIIAFANTCGGTVYIGVDDDGEAVGVDNGDFVIQQVINSIRDAVKPDLLMFMKCEIVNINDKEIVVIRVEEAPNKPYYIASKGLRREGVFIRVGTASNYATDAGIRQMIKEADGDIFEDMRSIEQELTFKHAKEVFEAQDIELEEPQMKTLGIINRANEYTNLGLLLSDQCPHIIRAAVFNGTNLLDFQDRCDFSGSVLKQMNDAYNYINNMNRTRATFNGLYRTDSRDYPEMALREAVVNSVVHRDYTRDVPTKISRCRDRVEIISYGSIPGGGTMDDIIKGISVCRNPKLANVFYRLNIIEAYGTGLKKMLDSYVKARKNTSVEPEFYAGNNMFKVTLPSLIFHEECEEYVADNVLHENGAAYMIGESKPERILALARLQGNSITRADVERVTGVSMSTANRMLKKLMEEGKLRCEGNGRGTVYIPVNMNL